MKVHSKNINRSKRYLINIIALLFFICFSSDLAKADSDNKLIAYFSFDNLESGYNGAGAKATLNGSVKQDIGVSGKAALLTDKTWMSVTKEDGTPLLAGLEEVTFSYYTDTTKGGGWSLYAAKDSSTQVYQYEHYIGMIDNTSSVTIERYNNNGSRPGTALKTSAKTGWKKVDLVFSQSGISYYVNGTLVSENDVSVKLTDILQDEGGILQLGKANWGNGEFFNGLIDEWKAYEGALDSDEIKKNYEADQVEFAQSARQQYLEALSEYIVEFPSSQGDYTKSTWNNLTNAKENAELILNDDTVTTEEIKTSIERFASAYEYATKVKETLDYTELGIPLGEEWLDTEGNHIQAHGGGFLQQTHEDGKPIYYWVGENKSHNGASFYAVSLYSSRNLVTWTNEGNILDHYSKTASGAENGLKDNKIERPKLLYNSKTKKYVLWGHWETSNSYSSSQICVATSDSPEGPYTFLGHWRPGGTEKNWRSDGGIYFDSEYSKSGEERQYIDDFSEENIERWGYLSRDFTVFQDGDDAFLVHAEGHNMRVQRLNENFTDVDLNTQEWTSSENRDSSFTTYSFYNGAGREAPAVVKVKDSGYYMVTSGQSGWMPNQTIYGYTEDLSDPNGFTPAKDSETGNLAEKYATGNNASFYSQPTNIMTVTDEAGNESYVYMGDRWTSKALGSSRYVWLPLEIDTETHSVALNYSPDWKLDTSNGSIKLSDSIALVSQGKEVIGSEENADRPLSCINDGNYYNLRTWGDSSTYYQPKNAPFEVVTNLGKQFDLNRMDISWRLYNGSEMYYKYKVFGSNDNVNWDELQDRTDNQWVGFTSDSLNGKYQYVKLAVTEVKRFSDNADGNWARGIVEIQIFAEQDKTKLKQILQDEESKNRDQSDYTSESWQAYEEEHLKAKIINQDSDTNQDEIDDAILNFQRVIDKLEKNKGEEILPKSIKVNITDLSVIKVNRSIKVIATVGDEDASNKDVTWKISNPNVLKMTENGELLGLKPGISTVTVSTVNNISKSFVVRITQ